MSYQALNIIHSGAVTRLQLNRPESSNALTEAMHWELHRALDAFAADESQRVCVIGAVGDRSFCSGSDLKEHIASGGVGHAYPPSGYAGLTERFDLTKPVIAEVNGAAVGGGLELILACDLAIAVDTARFGLPEPLIGGVALGLGIQRLARHVGAKHASDLALTGRLIEAPEALTLGLVNAVVPREQLSETTQLFVERLLAAAPNAQRASKAILANSFEYPTLPGAGRRTAGLSAVVAWVEASEAAEGTRAFVERRRPIWDAAAPQLVDSPLD
ncbi:MAG: enoyl-CoA hydratase [Hyphomicrobiales bacterium]|nr:MAG: enoyl-CoA hydratase [Hyphomicrobiales bacterium]